MDYTDINSEDKLVQATFASTSTMSSAGIACTPGTTRHLAPGVHWADCRFVQLSIANRPNVAERDRIVGMPADSGQGEKLP